jgi:hypothetical protein
MHPYTKDVLRPRVGGIRRRKENEEHANGKFECCMTHQFNTGCTFEQLRSLSERLPLGCPIGGAAGDEMQCFRKEGMTEASMTPRHYVYVHHAPTCDDDVGFKLCLRLQSTARAR